MSRAWDKTTIRLVCFVFHLSTTLESTSRATHQLVQIAISIECIFKQYEPVVLSRTCLGFAMGGGEGVRGRGWGVGGTPGVSQERIGHSLLSECMRRRKFFLKFSPYPTPRYVIFPTILYFMPKWKRSENHPHEDPTHSYVANDNPHYHYLGGCHIGKKCSISSLNNPLFR